MSSPVDEMVALRRAVLRRYPEYDVDSEQALAALREQALAACANPDALRVLEGRAVLLLWTEKTPLGWRAQRGRVDVAPDDVEAVDWVGEQLRQLRPKLDGSVELQLDAAHAALLPHAEAAGLAPRLKLLHGAPRRALAGLRAAGLDPAALGDLRIAALEDEHIEEVVTLYQDVFSELPELGILPPSVELTEAVQRGLDDFLRSKLRGAVRAASAFAVLRDAELLGHGAAYVRDDALMGRVGGVGIALRPSVRRRGVGKLLYATLIERLIALDVEVMRGLSANPAVLHLAERMGRQLRGWRLEVAGRE